MLILHCNYEFKFAVYRANGKLRTPNRMSDAPEITKKVRKPREPKSLRAPGPRKSPAKPIIPEESKESIVRVGPGVTIEWN